MRAFSNLVGKLLFRGPFKPRSARARARDWIRDANRCECGAERVVDEDGHTHCPKGCRSSGHRAIIADVQAKRAMADVPTKALSDRLPRFDEPWVEPTPMAVDYRLELEKDTPFPDWLNSARKAWSASVEPPVATELSPEDTEERPALKYMIGLRQMAREGDMLYGQLPQNKPDV